MCNEAMSCSVCVCVCVCVCQNSVLQVTDKEQPQVQQNVEGNPFPPNGDVRHPKTEYKCQKTGGKVSITSKCPLGAQKEKKRN